jgi:hypothetical protein
MSSIDPDYDLVIETFTAIWPRVTKSGFQQLSDAEKVILCTWRFVCEVNNGGFHQFFFNSSGAYAVETVSALESVQMPFAASLLRRALAAFPDPAKDEQVRYQQLISLPAIVQHDLFDELSAAFFDSGEDAYGLQAEFIRAHREGFIRPLAGDS